MYETCGDAILPFTIHFQRRIHSHAIDALNIKRSNIFKILPTLGIQKIEKNIKGKPKYRLTDIFPNRSKLISEKPKFTITLLEKDQVLKTYTKDVKESEQSNNDKSVLFNNYIILNKRKTLKVLTNKIKYSCNDNMYSTL